MNDNILFSKKRAAIVDALTRAVETFTTFKEKFFSEEISNGLGFVAEAAGFDRLAIYNFKDIDGEKRLGQIYRWDKAAGGMISLHESLLVLPKNIVLDNWLSILKKKESIFRCQSTMTEDEKIFLDLYNVKSIFMTPVFSDGEFWGMANFQDLNEGVNFSESCDDLLHTVANLWADAIIRETLQRKFKESFETLEQNKKITETLNRMSLIFLSNTTESFEEVMTTGIGVIADVADVDRVSIWINHSTPDGLYATQINRWDREAGGSMKPTDDPLNIPYTKFATYWEKMLQSGKSINSPVNLLPEGGFMRTRGTASIFVAPIFVKGDFWGFVIFSDHRNERYFDNDCAEMMRSAAFLCANAVIRDNLEQEIIKAARINKAILEAMPVGMVIFNGSSEIVYCNDEISRMFNASKKHITERYFEDFSPEYMPMGQKTIDEASNIINRAMAGETVKTEWPHKTADGVPVPCELTLTRVKDEDEFIGLGFLYDLRNIKKMSADLQKQSELLKSRLEHQELISEITKSFVASGETDILILEAMDKIRRYLNAARIVIFGIDYERDNIYMAYNNCAENVSPPTMTFADTHALIKNSFPEMLPADAVTPVLTCDDVTKDPVLKVLTKLGISALVGVPIYVEDRLWGLFSIEHHAAMHQWQEIELSFILTLVSVIAGAIMRKIYNDRLKNALERATAASEAKGIFLSNMSHEIRTPMNAIIGMTVIGKSAEDLARKDYCFEKIENASQHLLGVINDVLDMSKIEANKFELSDIEFDFEKMLQRVVNIVAFRADEKRQNFSVHIDKSIPRMLFGDDQRLAQVITNLLSNAVKFTPEEGSIKLDTRFISKEDDLYTMQVTVRDTGIGITPEQQRLLFQSFQQAESGTSRRFGGSGLGLVISKNIVEMMGGHFELESEAGKGSSFSFTFKMERGTKKVQNLYRIGVDWSNIKIMAVDDDKEVLDYFKEILQGFGADCDTALNGNEALGLIGVNGMYDIYFVDWKMPEMDGIMLARALKARSETPEQTIIIMISAAEWSSIAEDAKKAGVDKFLSKPLFPSAIVDVITEVIGLKHLPEKEQLSNTDNFDGFKILLAEDVEINREIVEALVAPTLLAVDCAENGVIAIDKFEDSPNDYDLILMDVQMPEMDGYEATRRIRGSAHARAKTVPIIAMTANVFSEDIEKCLEAGMNGHVGKPLNMEEFFNMLRRYLKKTE